VEEVPLPELTAITESKQPVILSPEEFKGMREQILRFIYLKEYDKALALIEKISAEGERMADIHYLAADIYANMNRYEEAKAKLKKALAIDSLFAPAYYLTGCMYLEEDKTEKAKESFQKALYIDKDFVMARFYMAHVLRGEGRANEAIREYRNTLAILSKGVPGARSEMTLHGSGFNAATLKSICCDNLERLKMELV
jgi:tetratricopeptide (TPR) repeat protein